MIVIRHDFDDSYLGLGITLHNLFEIPFLSTLFCYSFICSLLFSSCIAKGLAMGRLGV